MSQPHNAALEAASGLGSKRYSVPDVGSVIVRGFTPHGWPLVNLERDPPYFGKLVIQGPRGEELNRHIKAWAKTARFRLPKSLRGVQ